MAPGGSHISSLRGGDHSWQSSGALVNVANVAGPRQRFATFALWCPRFVRYKAVGVQVRVTGKIVRFDDTRGYGFIAPDGGGDDVFLHANDLELDREFVRAGARVEFDIEDGPRGQFATSVQPDPNAPAPVPSAGRTSSSVPGDDYFDYFSIDEFKYGITELLLSVKPPLNGDQVLAARSAFEVLAKKHGWAE